MRYFVHAIAWIATACAIGFTVYMTKEVGALVAFIFPTVFSISTKSNKSE